MTDQNVVHLDHNHNYMVQKALHRIKCEYALR